MLKEGLASSQALGKLRKRLYLEEQLRRMVPLEYWRAKQVRQTNPWLKDGDMQSFQFLNDDGSLEGTVSAFIRKEKDAEGYIGYFECSKDHSVASRLISAAETWLKDKGVQSVTAVVNAGERHELWGLRKEERIQLPFAVNINKVYYQDFFSQASYLTLYEQFVYARMVEQPLPEIFQKIGKRATQQHHLSIEPFNLKEKGKFISAFCEVYNEAWREHGNEAIAKEAAEKLFRDLRPIIDPKLLYFCFDNEKPIAFFLAIPDLNSLGIDWSTKFKLLLHLKIFFALKFRKAKSINGLLFGVIPSYRRKGIPALLIDRLQRENQHRYKHIYLNWIGSFNPGMKKMVEKMGFTMKSSLATFKKEF